MKSRRWTCALAIVAFGLLIMTVTLYFTCAELDSIVVEQTKLKEDALQENTSLSQQLEESQKTIEDMKVKIEDQQERISTLEKQLANKTTYPDTNLNQTTYVWNRLKGMGLNDYVAAGIVGNMMAEVGGNTLDLSLYSTRDNGSGYYGLCQWGGSRKDTLISKYGKSVEAQMNFLSVELKEVFPEGSSFYSLMDEKEAAYQFARYYERCSSSTYGVRKTNATTALKHFTGGNA